MRVAVAAVQLTSSDRPESNLEKSEEFIREAASRGAKIVALPENFAYLRSEGEDIPVRQAVDGPFIGRMRGLARELAIYLLCGSIPEEVPGSRKLWNTSILLNPRGESIAVYRKIHLFDIDIPGRASFQESRFVEPGNETVVASTEYGMAGLTICYDLRFPELYRKLTMAGAQMIFVPSAFTEYTGRDHWKVLLRARAIENQAFLIAPAQYGQHNPKRRSYGRSMIIDPWGEVLATAPDGEGVILADLDFAALDRVRRELPALQHIRLK